MKKFLLSLVLAGSTATVAWSQIGAPGPVSDVSMVTVNIIPILALEVISGDDLQYTLANEADYGNPATARLTTELRVASASDDVNLTASASGNLTAGSTAGAPEIPISEVSVGVSGGTLVPLNLSTPASLASGIQKGVSTHLIDVSVENISFGEYVPESYTGQITWTASYN